MSSKKVLGRGLGAFFPDIDEQSEGKSNIDEKETPSPENISDAPARLNTVIEVPVEHIRPNPNQPRKEFDEESLEELAGSIQTYGLIQPVTVRFIGDKRFELISGERRLRAARQAGVETLPAYVREVDDEEILSLALVENIQREDLNPIEVALGYRRLMDEAGQTQAGVAKKVGKNRSTVANMLRLLNLPAYVQAALRDRQISMGHARALVNVEKDSDKQNIFKKIIEHGYSVRQTEKAVRALTNQKTSSKSSDTSSSENAESTFLKDISSRLRSTLSTKVRVKSKKREEKYELNTTLMKNWNDFLSFLSRFHKLLCLCLLLSFGLCKAQSPGWRSSLAVSSSPQVNLRPFRMGGFALDTTSIMPKYPDPHKVMYRSMMIPGWGQIINNQIYKVPIIYALLGGLTWYSIHLTKLYHDYRAAYYNQNSRTPNDLRFGPTPAYLKNVNLSLLKKKRDIFHNRRDFIYISIVLAYGLNVLDAYIFAHLRSFNVSKDLSVRTTIHPSMIAQATPGVTISFSLFSREQ